MLKTAAGNRVLLLCFTEALARALDQPLQARREQGLAVETALLAPAALYSRRLLTAGRRSIGFAVFVS